MKLNEAKDLIKIFCLEKVSASVPPKGDSRISGILLAIRMMAIKPALFAFSCSHNIKAISKR